MKNLYAKSSQKADSIISCDCCADIVFPTMDYTTVAWLRPAPLEVSINGEDCNQSLWFEQLCERCAEHELQGTT